MVFPKITICNINPFVTDYAFGFLADTIRNNYAFTYDAGSNGWIDNNTKTWIANVNYANKTDLQIVNYFLMNVSSFDSFALYDGQKNGSSQFFGYGLTDFIQTCSWDGMICPGTWNMNANNGSGAVVWDMLNTWDYSQGNCYTFNYNTSSPMTSSSSGIFN